MSEKMREEFESWAISCHMCTYLDGVEYRHQSTEWAWMAWQASRAALVVELPCSAPGGDGYMYEDAYACGQHDCIAEVKSLLDDAGVSYK